MANLVSIISTANTFYEWMGVTINLTKENNTLAKDDYIKDTGVLILNGTPESMRVAGKAIFYNTLQSAGPGSNVFIDNTLAVGGLTTLANTEFSLLANGKANIQGPLFATAPNTGLSVSNTANIGASLNVIGPTSLNNVLTVTGDSEFKSNASIKYNLTANNVQANSSVNTTTLSVTGTAFSNVAQANISVNTRTLSVTGTSFADIIQANSSVNTRTLSVTGTAFSNVAQANLSVNTTTLSVTGNGFADIIQGNSSVNTRTLSVTGNGFADIIQANSSVNTRTLSVTGTGFADIIQGNSSVNTRTLSVTGTGFADIIQGNSSVNTRTLSVTGTGFVNVLQANSSINTSNLSVVNTAYANVAQANISVNTRTLSVTGTGFADIIQGNSSVNTRTLSVTGNGFADIIQANSSVNTRTLSVTGTGFADIIQANSSVNTRTLSVTGTGFADIIQANSSVNTRTLSVTGTGFADIIQGNSSVNTRTLSVTGTGFADIIQANSSVNTITLSTRTLSVTGTGFADIIQANSSVNTITLSTRTLSVTGNAFSNVVQANISVNTRTLSVTGTAFADIIQANSSVNTVTLNVTSTTDSSCTATGALTVAGGAGIAKNMYVGGKIIAGGDIQSFGSLILTGTTVYSSNVFVLGAGQITPFNGSYALYRPGQTANAEIRWIEADKTWKIANTYTNVYSRIVTDEVLANGTLSLVNTSVIIANVINANSLAVGGSSGYELVNRTTIAAAGVNSALLGFRVGGISSGYVFADTNHVEFGAPTGRYLTWDINGEQMRLSSTGLGIGTSTISEKLNVVNNGSYAAIRVSNGTNSSLFGYANADGNYNTLAKAGDAIIRGAVGVSIEGNNGSGGMRLDAFGNLGLGVTPSAWTTSSTAKAFEIGTVGNALYGFSGSNLNVTSGAYYNSGWKYAVSSLPVSYYNQSNGLHQWYNAPSGTAGNAITFTQAMTLDASGRLGIGTISPNYALQVKSGTASGTLSLSGGAETTGGASYILMGNNDSGGVSGPTVMASANRVMTWGLGSSFTAAGGGTFTELMRLDTSGNLGIGVTPSAWWNGSKVQQIGRTGVIEGRTAVEQFTIGSNYFIDNVLSSYKYAITGAASRFEQYSGGFYFLTAPSDTAGNIINFTQVMTLNASGNLGIGTNSPTARLSITNSGTGNLALATFVSGNGLSATIASPASAGSYLAGALAGDFVLRTEANSLCLGTTSKIIFGTPSVEYGRFDASGNLGLGVTPSAWTTSAKAIQISSVASIFGGSNFTGLGNNFYSSVSGNKYLTNAYASFYYQDASSGQHQWYTAPSGTAGNAITFNQAMTLNASGNLGLGVTPSAWNSSLRVFQASSTALYNNGANDTYLGSNFYTDTGGTNRYINSDVAAVYGQVDGFHAWYTAPSGTAGNAITFTQAMTLNASGNLGIGTTTPASKLHVNGGARFGDAVYLNGTVAGLSSVMEGYSTVYGRMAAWRSVPNDGINPFFAIDTNSNGITLVSDGSSYRSMMFQTGGQERMRLDASGNLGLGVTPSAWGGGYTSYTNKLYGEYYSSNGGFVGLAANAYYNGTNWIYKNNTTANRFESTLDSFRWYTAPSGTAGNAITFTQAMTLDASGNFLLGTTSSDTSAASAIIERSGTTAATGAYLVIKNQNANQSTSGVLTPAGGILFSTYRDVRSPSYTAGITYEARGVAGTNTGAELVFRTASGVGGNFTNEGNGAPPPERMRLDAFGNLGLGTAPSAWGTSVGSRALDVSAYAGFGTFGGSTVVTYNAYYNASNQAIYKLTGVPARAYSQETNGHSWFTAPTGTAGNPITFKQAMTLDASGNLGLGTTTLSDSAGFATLSLSGSTGGQLAFQTSGTGKQYIYSNSSDLNFYNAQAGNLIFFTNTTERMRLDAFGNLGLGTAPSAWGGGSKALEFPIPFVGMDTTGTAVFGCNAYNYASGFWRYKYPSSESNATLFAAKMDGSFAWYTSSAPGASYTTWIIINGQSYTTSSSGNQTAFGAPNNNVGTTWTATSSGTLSSGTVVQNITFNQLMRLDNVGLKVDVKVFANTGINIGTTAVIDSSGNWVGPSILATASTINATDTTLNSTYYPVFVNAAGLNSIARVRTTSQAFTFNPYTGDLTIPGNMAAYSDRRLKSNIKNIENALDKVINMQGVSYDDTNGRPNIGLVAQDVLKVLPEVVLKGDEYYTLSYSNIVAVLIEAIKELKKEIDELKK